MEWGTDRSQRLDTSLHHLRNSEAGVCAPQGVGDTIAALPGLTPLVCETRTFTHPFNRYPRFCSSGYLWSTMVRNYYMASSRTNNL